MSRWSEEFESQFKSIGKLKKFSKDALKKIGSSKEEKKILKKKTKLERRLEKI